MKSENIRQFCDFFSFFFFEKEVEEYTINSVGIPFRGMKQSLSLIKRGILRGRHITDARNAFKSLYCEKILGKRMGLLLSAIFQRWES